MLSRDGEIPLEPESGLRNQKRKLLRHHIFVVAQSLVGIEVIQLEPDWGPRYHVLMNLPVVVPGAQEVVAFGTHGIRGDRIGGDEAGLRDVVELLGELQQRELPSGTL
jgi:hypothetical protein